MEAITVNPVFGVLLSLIAYQIGVLIFKKTKLQLLNPLLTGTLITMGFLLIFGIPYENYRNGGNIILFLLGPATVVLAVPLYNRRELLKKYFLPIVAGIFVGAMTSIVSVWIMCNLLGIDQVVTTSLIPKSVTNPIGMEISRQSGGDPSFTVAAIVFTGIFGAVIGQGILKLFRINDKVAQGVALGTSAHGLGTAKAMEMGETQGAMAGISIGITGIITVILVPIFLWLVN